MADIESKTLPSYRPETHLADKGGVLVWTANSSAADVKDFNASGSRKTATGTQAAGSNLLTVTRANAAAFLATCKIGHGIFVTGGGVEGRGSDLVERITAINGSVLTLAFAATAAVTNAFICHDDTEAIQAAINSGYYRAGEIPGVNLPSGSGRPVFLSSGVFGDEGYYQVNKKWIASHNSILTIPIIPVTEQSRSFKMTADFRVSPHWVNLDEANNPLKARGGATLSTRLQGTGVYPAIISAKIHSSCLGDGYQAAFSHVSCHIEDIDFELPNTSTVMGANFGNAINSSTKRCFVHADIHQSLLTPANTHGGGFVMSQTNNTGLVYIEDTVVVGGKIGYVIGEHTQLRYAFGAFCNLLFRITESHRPIFGTFGGEHNICTIETTGQASINLSGNIEYFSGTTGFATPRYGFIKDATNSLFGSFGTNFTEGNVGLTSRQATVTGCQGLKFTQTTMPFAVDDGSAANPLVERLLTAPGFTSGAVMKDDFRIPGNLQGRVPDTLQLGAQTWTVTEISGGVAIVKNGAAETSAGGYVRAFYNADTPNRTIRLRTQTGIGLTIVCRKVDDNNYIYGLFDRSGGGSIGIFKRVAGVDTLVGTITTNLYTTAGDWISIGGDGANLITLKINNTIVQTATIPDGAAAIGMGFTGSQYVRFSDAEII